MIYSQLCCYESGLLQLMKYVCSFSLMYSILFYVSTTIYLQSMDDVCAPGPRSAAQRMEPGGDTGAGVVAVGAAPGQQWKRRMMGTARSPGDWPFLRDRCHLPAAPQPGAAAEQPAALAGRHLPDGRRRRPVRSAARCARCAGARWPRSS
jgi:hypothetical protein